MISVNLIGRTVQDFKRSELQEILSQDLDKIQFLKANRKFVKQAISWSAFFFLKISKKFVVISHIYVGSSEITENRAVLL